MIRHGPLSQSDAERLSATMQQSEDNKRRLDSLQPMDVLIIPAKFTGGANGAHAWTRQRIDATGGRYDDPLTFTGQVSGVSSMTVTWQPARLPGTTAVLPTFPVYGYVTPIGLTPSTGPNYEIINSGVNAATPSTMVLLKIIAGSANPTYGFPARVQIWDSGSNSFSDLNNTTVYVSAPNQLPSTPPYTYHYEIGDFVDARLLGPSGSGFDAYESVPRSKYVTSGEQINTQTFLENGQFIDFQYPNLFPRVGVYHCIAYAKIRPVSINWDASAMFARLGAQSNPGNAATQISPLYPLDISQSVFHDEMSKFNFSSGNWHPGDALEINFYAGFGGLCWPLITLHVFGGMWQVLSYGVTISRAK